MEKYFHGRLSPVGYGRLPIRGFRFAQKTSRFQRMGWKRLWTPAFFIFLAM
jgi:hypothetical protein